MRATSAANLILCSIDGHLFDLRSSNDFSSLQMPFNHATCFLMGSIMPIYSWSIIGSLIGAIARVA